MCRVSFCFVGATIGRPRTPAAMASLPGGYGIRPYGVGVGVPDDPGGQRLPQGRRAANGRPYSLPLAPSARGLRPQAVGERTVRLPEIFRAMARFSPSAPSGHLPRRGRFFDTMRLPPRWKSFCYACSCTYRINASRSAVVRTTAVYIQSPMSRRSAWGIRSHIRIREPYLAMICAWVCLYSWQSRRPA